MSDLQKLNSTDLATLLDITTRRVEQLVREGVFTKEKRGVYDGPKCVKAYIDFVKSGGGERARLYKAQADLKEMEAAQRRGELGTIEDFKNVLIQVYATYTQELPAIASRLANPLANTNEPGIIRHRIYDEVQAVIGRCADLIEQYFRNNGASVDVNAEAGKGKTATKPGAVGKRKPSTTKRKRRTRKV